ncbi:unnamed protein product [Polarella glacialis]|uniref:Maleate isomerase n=1 Tax=Polarella glacialis TaxID=89957 RepID=A0A813FII0_POLGL|nr:unnamed protein product [Polarella glacialis]
MATISQPKARRLRCILCHPDLLQAALATQGGKAQLRQRLRNIPRASCAMALVRILATHLEDFQEFNMAILDPHWHLAKQPFKAELTERTGLNIATGAEACKASLEKFGAKRITIITPYQEIGDKNVVKFFTEIGFEVVRIAGLKCGSATDIAHVPEAWCEKVIRENLVLPGIDAIVQCGTNLAMVPLADRLERELGIPIIAINVACLWFGMREAGIDAKLQGCTRLFREH